MVYLPEWAHEGSVSIFHIKSTQETNVPIVIPFVYVGAIRILHLLYPSLSKWRLCIAPAIQDNVAGSCWRGPRGGHVISKQGTTPFAMPTSLIMPTLMASMTCMGCTSLKRSLLCRDG
jgi:hypothetical protein